jgi:hypothetical protein
MNKQDTILRTLFIIFSILTSFGFIFYGMSVINSPSTPKWATTFAIVVAGYGLGNIAILSLAWNSREKWAIAVNKLIALCFIGVVVMDTFKTGYKGGLQIVGILGLAVVLWCNWLAIKKVVERPG